ncbi:hypothetical protein [uncultured Propionibacterium sp.]|uniref:hypothetical protein n=1 Tax=uncultured Propionibacterium sp. TaxID=218066 RepID=UPI00292CDB6D|nr:hypothetical protein [uncultured Propionibacterium sp.]
MSLTTSELDLRDALREAGHLLPGARRGIDGHGPDFEAVVDGLWRAYFDKAPAGTRVMSFGPLIDAAQFAATDYPRSFPQLVGEVEVFRGGDARHRALIGDIDAGNDWTGHFEPSGMTLVPATCENVYPRYAGTLAAPATVACRSWCFRHEPSDDPMRMVSFRICEYVYLGTPEGAEALRAEWLELLVGFFRGLGLDVATDRANDPFFGRIGRMLAANQLQSGMKNEINIGLYPGRRTAISSSNAHRAHFAESFGIQLPGGEPAHTACAGFGIERVAIALFATHGMDVAGWPGPVRETLRLSGEAV